MNDPRLHPDRWTVTPRQAAIDAAAKRDAAYAAADAAIDAARAAYAAYAADAYDAYDAADAEYERDMDAIWEEAG